MNKLVTVLSFALIACASTPVTVSHAPEQSFVDSVVVSPINWQQPGAVVARAYCSRTIGDCYERIGKTCGTRGYVTQPLGDHDMLFVCRPKAEQSEAKENDDK